MSTKQLKRSASEVFPPHALKQVKRMRSVTWQGTMEANTVVAKERQRRQSVPYADSILVFTSAKSTPDVHIIRTLKELIAAGKKSQKQIAKEIQVSQTKMSQFMNGATRTKGWLVLEEKVLAWLQIYHQNGGNLPFESTSGLVPEPQPAMHTPVMVKNIYNPSQSGEYSTSSEPTSTASDSFFGLHCNFSCSSEELEMMDGELNSTFSSCDGSEIADTPRSLSGSSSVDSLSEMCGSIDQLYIGDYPSYILNEDINAQTFWNTGYSY